MWPPPATGWVGEGLGPEEGRMHGAPFCPQQRLPAAQRPPSRRLHCASASLGGGLVLGLEIGEAAEER